MPPYKSCATGAVVVPVPPFAMLNVPNVKDEGLVPEQVRNPPGHEFDITPVFVIVNDEPPINAPAVPPNEIPVPLVIDEVATEPRVAGLPELLVQKGI